MVLAVQPKLKINKAIPDCSHRAVVQDLSKTNHGFRMNREAKEVQVKNNVTTTSGEN